MRGEEQTASEATYAAAGSPAAGFTAPKCCDGGVGYDVWGQRRDCRGVAGGLQGLAADCREVHGGCREVQEVHTVDWPGAGCRPSGPPRFCCSQCLQQDQPAVLHFHSLKILWTKTLSLGPECQSTFLQNCRYLWRDCCCHWNVCHVEILA